MFNGTTHKDLTDNICEKRHYDLFRVVNQQQLQLDYQRDLIAELSAEVRQLSYSLSKLLDTD
jgi:hypothetical protein